jgi:hypothetical protein
LPLSKSVGQQFDHLINYPDNQSGSQLVIKLVDYSDGLAVSQTDDLTIYSVGQAVI